MTNKPNLTQLSKEIETRTMWMIFHPDGRLLLGSEHYSRKSTLEWASLGTRYTWRQQYKEGYRCKKVEVTYKEL